eukprot:3779887-Pleurochrysis_carterae.AAC.2
MAAATAGSASRERLGGANVAKEAGVAQETRASVVVATLAAATAAEAVAVLLVVTADKSSESAERPVPGSHKARWMRLESS